MSGRGAVVEGSLRYESDDSTDEEDVAQPEDYAAPPSAASSSAAVIDDDDDELEVFGAQSMAPRLPPTATPDATLAPRPPLPPAIGKGAKISLIDAMQASVSRVEAQARFEEEYGAR